MLLFERVCTAGTLYIYDEYPLPIYGRAWHRLMRKLSLRSRQKRCRQCIIHIHADRTVKTAQFIYKAKFSAEQVYLALTLGGGFDNSHIPSFFFLLCLWVYYLVYGIHPVWRSSTSYSHHYRAHAVQYTPAPIVLLLAFRGIVRQWTPPYHAFRKLRLTVRRRNSCCCASNVDRSSRCRWFSVRYAGY